MSAVICDVPGCGSRATRHDFARKRHTCWKHAPQKPIGKRSEPRRTRHPLPLPNGEPVAEADVLGEAVAFGPQAELCRRTMCAACYFVWCRRFVYNLRIDWTRLPEMGPGYYAHAHHEPHRSTRGDTHDEDTLPLCSAHHIDSVGDCVRHRVGFTDEQNARRFYALLPFDWRAVVAEMRRRVALTKPVVETASETT